MTINKKIINLLTKINVNPHNCDFKEINLKKYLVYINSKKKINYLLKVSFNKYTSTLFQNEIRGFKFFKKNKIFNLKNIKNIYNIKNISVLKTKYIYGKTVNYFELKNFYNVKYLPKKKINISQYEKILKKNFKTINNYKIDKIKEFKILEKINNKNIELSASHGDFVYWNCIKKKKLFYVYDFEHFAKSRIYIYDILHWIIFPITIKFRYINYKLNYNLLLIYYVKLFLKYLNIYLDNEELIKYIILYFIEQKYFFYQAKSINQKHKIIKKVDLKNSVKLSNFYSTQIKIFIKYVN